MSASLNLMKLCVGCDDPAELAAWQKHRFGGGPARHVTRMWPRREAQVTAGGSLYWVIKGAILCRQRIVRLEEVRGADGILRCGIVMDPEVIRTEAAPRRPFQGWRYLEACDAPRDLPRERGTDSALPREMALALAEIGLR